MKKVAAAAVVTLLLGSNLAAMDEKKHAINICPLAIPFFDLYVLNYEYLLNKRHGFATRVEYSDISDGAIEATNKAVVVNYRWHLKASMASCFIGAFARYRVNSGTGTVGGTAFEFDAPERAVGLNVGKRWVWDNGFNIVLSAGYGYNEVEESVTPTSPAIQSGLSAFKDKRDTFFDNPQYAEFSAGYAF